jgi:hypothetical protein
MRIRYVFAVVSLAFLLTMHTLAGEGRDMMMFGDTSRTKLPFAKDPSVIRFKDQYLLYYSIGGVGAQGWSIGIARSDDLIHWHKIGELLPKSGTVEEKGIAAPGARVIDGKVHLFYQTYGNGPRDAICHAVSTDGLHFDTDPTNPIFHPTGKWNAGRAIDAEVFAFDGQLYLYYATRDPAMKIQMIGVAAADLASGYHRGDWKDLSPDGPVLKPELPWERDCIEAPTVCMHEKRIYMFDAGAYNNAPQQIGVAVSDDAVHFTRLSDQPLLPNGKPGEWNSCESGHPGIFVDDSGETRLFFQGNADMGKSWFISSLPIRWTQSGPVVLK